MYAFILQLITLFKKNTTYKNTTQSHLQKHKKKQKNDKILISIALLNHPIVKLKWLGD